jgi:hypothetical protein
MKYETDWQQMYRDELDIVDRCWKALGITTAEQARGKTIWELIAEMKTELDARKGPTPGMVAAVLEQASNMDPTQSTGHPKTTTRP